MIERDLKQYVILPANRERPLEIYIAMQRELFNYSWMEAQRTLQNRGACMLSPHDFLDFMKHLLSEQEVLNGERRVLSGGGVRTILEGIINPQQLEQEWLDAHFIERQGELYIATDHRRASTERGLEPSHVEKLQEHLQEEKNIDINYLIRFPTSQGLPKQDTPSGKTRYRKPKIDQVMRFGLGWERVLEFTSTKHPDFKEANIGVREAFIKR